MTYDDEHWQAVVQTIIDRVGLEHFLELLSEVYDDHWRTVLTTAIGRIGTVHFLELLSEVLHEDLQKIIDEHMRIIEVKGEG